LLRFIIAGVVLGRAFDVGGVLLFRGGLFFTHGKVPVQGGAIYDRPLNIDVDVVCECGVYVVANPPFKRPDSNINIRQPPSAIRHSPSTIRHRGRLNSRRWPLVA
jgi:hypothetical protein